MTNLVLKLIIYRRKIVFSF